MMRAADLLDDLRERLAALDEQGLRRARRIVESAQGPRLRVDGRTLLSFCSNDYLGLAAHPRIAQAAAEGAAQYGVGSGASALISGHSIAHERLETRLAQFVAQERALLFSTGYLANLAVVTALADGDAAIFSDRLNHASIIDGARLSRAQVHVYPHGDVDRLEALLAHAAARCKLVVTDAVFSMDGDIAPLPRLAQLCERHRAWLLVDDAHGFGVLGPCGRGSLAHFALRSPCLIHMGTLGKAAGVAGAFVAARAPVIEWLLQRARTYIFTTAAPALLSHALLAALDLIEQEAWRRERLAQLIAQLRTGAHDIGYRLQPSETAIQPIVVGDNEAALALSRGLLERDIWVPAIRPPTVPAGTARLRISLSAAHETEDVERLLHALHGMQRNVRSAA